MPHRVVFSSDPALSLDDGTSDTAGDLKDSETWADGPTWNAHRSRGGAQPLLPIGHVLRGRYTLLAVLGAGSFGAVYAARDNLNPQRDLALKTIAAEATDAALLELAKAEFLALTQLRHPNLARAFDFEFCPAAQVHFFTMERMHGEALRVDAPRTLREKAEILVQVLRALSYVHSRGIVHRDIKPGNIMVEADGAVRLVDFGLVGVRGKFTVVGSPGFMAPEAFSGVNFADHRADLYSVGLVAYDMVCAPRPIETRSLREFSTRRRAVAFDFTRFPDLPAGWQTWLTCLCHTAPDARYANANVALVELNRLCGFDFAVETAATGTSYVLSGRFTGREAETRAVWDFVLAATGGTIGGGPRSCWIEGPSGIGKSRLMREIQLRSELHGLLFIEGAAGDDARDEWAPISAALRRLVPDATPDADAPETQDIVALLALLAPALGAMAPAGATPARVIADRAAEVLYGLAVRTPFVLFINDAHRARASVLAVLEGLVVRLRRAPSTPAVALVATVRPDARAGQPIEAFLRAHADDVRYVALMPLGPRQIRELVESMLGGVPVPAALLEVIGQDLGGNPALIEDMMESLVEHGALLGGDGRWKLPTDVEQCRQRLVEADTHRLDHLPKQALHVLQALVLHPQPMRVDVLAHAVGLEPEETWQSLLELTRRHMVTRALVHGVTFQVYHSRLRQTVRDAMTPDAQRAGHEALAQAYEALDPHNLSALALHYRQAGNLPVAGQYLLAAGAQARLHAGAETALGMYQDALALLPTDQHTQRLQATEAVADLHVLLGDYAAARAAYERVYADGPAQHHVELDVKVGLVHVQCGEYQLAVRRLLQPLAALDIVPPRSEPAFVASLLVRLATHAWTRVVLRKPAAASERARLATVSAAHLRLAQVYLFVAPPRMLHNLLAAVAAAERVGESTELANAYGLLSVFYCIASFRDAALQLAMRAQRIAQTCATEGVQGKLRSYRALVHLCRLECDVALEGFSQAQRELAKHGDQWELGAATSGLSDTLRVMGRVPGALEVSLRGFEHMERTGSLVFGRILVGQVVILLAEVGRHEDAAEYGARAREIAAMTDDGLSVTTVNMCRAHATWLAGDLGGACAQMEIVCAAMIQAGVRMDMAGEAFVTLLLCQLEHTWFGGDVDPTAARAALKHALRWVRGKPMHRTLALAADAAYAIRAGKHKEAQQKLSAAQWHAKAHGLELMHADASLVVGREWLRLPEFQAQGRRLVEEAQRAYDRLGATARSARANQALTARPTAAAGALRV